MSFDSLDAELLDELGESATYTPAGGSPKTVQVLIEMGVQELDGGYISQRQNHALIADRTIASAAGDIIKTSKSTYTVAGLVDDDGYLTRLLLS